MVAGLTVVFVVIGRGLQDRIVVILAVTVIVANHVFGQGLGNILVLI